MDNQTDIRKDLVFFPQYLQQLGYRTAFMGKWHMGHESDEPRPGFDKWVSFQGQGEYYNTMLNIDGKKIKSTKHISDELTDYAVEWLKQDRDKRAVAHGSTMILRVFLTRYVLFSCDS